MHPIKIRHSESKDANAIRDIFSGKHAYSGTLQLPYPLLSFWESRYETTPPGIYRLVAEINGELVGHIHFEVCQNPRRKHVASFGMAVKDSCCGKGVGSKLLAAIIDLAENWLNIERIELTVYTDNEAAIGLYKNMVLLLKESLPGTPIVMGSMLLLIIWPGSGKQGSES